MSVDTSLPVWEQLDLKNDAILEASAGTGKTFAIQKIVCRLLCATPGEAHTRAGNSRLNIEDVLVVTFTDKATEELKVRIRQELESAIQLISKGGTVENELVLHLRRNLAHINKANIQTMHGFCHSVLQQKAFEAGFPLSGNLVDDFDGLAEELRKSIRKKKKGELLPLLDRLGNERGRSILVQCAKRLSQRLVVGEDQKEGQSVTQWIRDKFSEEEEAVSNVMDVIRDMEQRLTAVLDMRTAFCEEAGANGEKLFGKIESLGDDLLKKVLEGRVPLSSIVRNLKAHPAEGLSTQKAKKALEKEEREVLRQFLDDWWGAIQRLKGLSQYEDLKLNLLSFCNDLSQSWKLRKEETGSLSFDDMIIKLADALESCSSSLLASLQEDYVYGIIDEFQDTDPEQWFIFNQIFRKRKNPGALMVVGDPKQAIYRFRGADLGTYMKATAEMLADEAQILRLGMNYRSTPSMIVAYNSIFSRDGWFEGGDSTADVSSGVGYEEEVGAGRYDIGYELQGPEEWKASPIRFCDLRHINKVGPQRVAYARWTLERIRWLVPDEGRGPLMIPFMDEETVKHRSPDYGDIAVLCETRSQGRELQDLLTREGIPWREYGREGVLSSPAAKQWICLLEALGAATDHDDASRRVGLGWFFGFGKGLDREGQLKIRARDQLSKWRDLAEKELWAVLLHKIVMDSGVEEYLLDREEGERNISDLRQLQEIILDHLLLGGDGLLDTARWLGRAASGEEEKVRTNLHQLESDRAKVIFLTMHKAKGLEFPIVILQPSVGPGKVQEPYPLSQLSDGRRLLKPFSKSHQAVARRDSSHERARLLYVAFTRPISLLFCPLFMDDKWPYSELYQLVESKNLALENLDTPLPLSSNSVDDSDDEMPSDRSRQIDVASSLQVKWNGLQNRLNRFGIQTSFSGMTASKKKRFQDAEDGGREFDKAQEEEGEKKASTALPYGKHAGNLLHDIFEKGDWEFWSNWHCPEGEALLEVIGKEEGEAHRVMKNLKQSLMPFKLGEGKELNINHPLVKAMEEVQKIIRNTLEVEISLAEDLAPFSLKNLSKGDRIAELEFRMLMDRDSSEEEEGESFLLGYIDLVFRRPLPDGGHRYYVLDWKSNGLSTYDESRISECMIDHDYEFQAEIYVLALHRWLSRRLGDEYQPEKHLGGAVYAFVRGQLKEESPSAFWKKSYSLSELDGIANRLEMEFKETKRSFSRWSR